MSRIAVLLFVLLAALVPNAARAADPAVMDREVGALMDALRTSSCQFNRNGAWYEGAEAASHLKRKYDYLRSKLETTEQFIEKGASTSSMSGKAYLVRCGDAKEVTSGEWLTTKLAELRKD